MAEPKARHSLASLDERVTALENVADEITKIKNMIKIYFPIILTALVTSGVVNGKWGAFLRALVSGQ